MILTDKCLEDFNKYIDDLVYDRLESYTHFNSLDKICRDAFIIEFFDSVGIFIEIGHRRGIDPKTIYWNVRISDINKSGNMIIICKDTHDRNLATKDAIKECNEMYNNIK